MNKLKEILDQFELDWGYFKLRCHKYLPNGEKLSAGWITEKDVKKYIQMACVEYARSKVPKKKGMKIDPWDNVNIALASGYDRCISKISKSIDQDLQSLNK